MSWQRNSFRFYYTYISFFSSFENDSKNGTEMIAETA